MQLDGVPTERGARAPWDADPDREVCRQLQPHRSSLSLRSVFFSPPRVRRNTCHRFVLKTAAQTQHFCSNVPKKVIMPVPVPYTPKKITGRNVLSTVRRVVSVNNGRRERSRSPLRVEQSTERDSPQSPDSDGVSLHVRGSESPAAQAVEESGDSDDELDWHIGKNRDTFQHMKRIIAALTDDPRHNFSLIKTPNSISIRKPGMLIQLMKDDGSIYRNVNVDKFNRPDFTRKPERVVKAVRAFGAMLFQIKWKNVQETDLVPLKIVKKKWPRFLLKFYKKHLNMSIFNMHDT